MLPIDALIEPLTEEQVKATIYTLLAALGITTTSWKRGGVTRTLIAVLAMVIAGFTLLMAAAIRGTILELATGGWLTLLARYVYGVERITATFAETGVTLANSGGGEYSLDPGDLIVLNTTSGKTYKNVNSIALGSMQTLTGVRVRAVEPGSEGNAASGQIDGFETPLLGVTVTNPEAAVGIDEQDDVSLRQDCADARAALSPFGPSEAYKYFAKRVPGGAPLTRADGSTIGVNRTQVTIDNLGGAITVFVATASGDVAGDVNTPGDDLYVVDQNLRTWAMPAGVTLTTQNANAVDLTVQYNVWADAASGLSANDVKQKIDAALTAYFATFSLGGATRNGTNYYAFLSKIQGLIESADPSILSVSLPAPLGDVAMDPGDRIHLILSGSSTVAMVSQ